jgi:hypothetical protein
MRQRADQQGVDLLLIDTGDRVEGNGLYDGSSPKGLFTNEILRAQQIDLMSTGNHELYVASTARREHEQTVPIFQDSYIASNLDYIDPNTGKRVPQAPQRYKRFKTPKLGIDIVAFGFLFDFTGNANNTVVQPVEQVIKEDWFQQVISGTEKPDLFIVIGHVAVRMPEFQAVHAAIRKHNPDTAIAYFCGHAHVRDALKYDKNSFSMASGRYMETIGWMSIDGIKPPNNSASIDGGIKFTRKYIDNNLFGYHYHTGLDDSTFRTPTGVKVSNLIRTARQALNLDYVFGCAPKDLWMSQVPYRSNDSIFTWLETEVLPDIAVRKGRENIPRVAIFNTGGIRFDIFAGPFTRDSTYIVSPFVSKFQFIPNMPLNVANQVLALLNGGGKIFDAAGLDIRRLMIPQQMVRGEMPHRAEESTTDLKSRDLGEQRILGGDSSDKPELIGGYTTKDDFGDDGDDTVRLQLKFYNVPNCIRAEIAFPKEGNPETVDMVFLDFLQPWIMVALKSAGGNYSEKDVLEYREGTFTYLMAEWIRTNWKGTC